MRPAALPVLGHAHARQARRPPLAIVRDAPVLRAAHAADAPAVHALLEQFVGFGLLLPRTLEQVARSIDDYIVAVEGDRIVGSVALRRYSPALAEIGALAVAPHLHGTGLGRRLVEAAVAIAREDGLARVFALTMQDGFFRRLGFEAADIAEFPQKVALDCSACSRRHACAEKAVALAP